MAGLEPLVAHIYHERQQAGSMLCAQHAINAVLQGNYFGAADLADIGRNLDALEQSYDDDNHGRTSTNMDDTGFFSVQVLDHALNVWGLNLVRWKSEQMKPYLEHPHTQLAFILNLEQHWFTLRRFGNALPNPDQDQGDGHWFNLNSFLEKPEWVSKVYLGMVLQQAEQEGYSVFAVVQANPDGPLALPRTEADVLASTLPEPSSSSSSRTSFKRTLSGAGEGAMDVDHEDFGDEDLELQAALQASLLHSGASASEEQQAGPAPANPITSAWPQNRPRRELSDPLESESTPSPSPLRNPLLNLPGHADVDPVTASRERNRYLLLRMQEEQERAAQALWSEEDLNPEERTALEERRRLRQQQEEEEAEQLRLAIEESKRLAEAQGTSEHSTPQPAEESFDDDPELQEALKASLAYMTAMEKSSADETSEESSSTKPPAPKASDDSDDETETESLATSVVQLPQAPTVDELRRARLARFGG